MLQLVRKELEIISYLSKWVAVLPRPGKATRRECESRKEAGFDDIGGQLQRPGILLSMLDSSIRSMEDKLNILIHDFRQHPEVHTQVDSIICNKSALERIQKAQSSKSQKVDRWRQGRKNQQHVGLKLTEL